MSGLESFLASLEAADSLSVSVYEPILEPKADSPSFSVHSPEADSRGVSVHSPQADSPSVSARSAKADSPSVSADHRWTPSALELDSSV